MLAAQLTFQLRCSIEEDRKDPDVWYLDHNYLEEMESMFRKVNTKEKIVGFYSTGPKLRTNDLQIEALFRRSWKTPSSS